MNLDIAETGRESGRRAAAAGAERLREALTAGGKEIAIVLATGSSQLDMLDHLVAEPGIDWERVTAFHLDEYVGISPQHPASFRRYMRERFVERLPRRIGDFHYIDGNADPNAELQRLSAFLQECDLQVAFVGIGENGHLAFNEPPADFDTRDPYLVVRLDETSRRQQLGEGWFEALDEVPELAISMSIRQIMTARTVICTVPDERKAVAVFGAVKGPVTPQVPASILQSHPDCRVFLDSASASRLTSAAGS